MSDHLPADALPDLLMAAPYLLLSEIPGGFDTDELHDLAIRCERKALDHIDNGNRIVSWERDVLLYMDRAGTFTTAWCARTAGGWRGSSLRLDLRRFEVCCLVTRVLARCLGMDAGNTAPAWYREDFTGDGDWRWVLECGDLTAWWRDGAWADAQTVYEGGIVGISAVTDPATALCLAVRAVSAKPGRF